MNSLRVPIILSLAAMLAWLHEILPAGPHGWHWAHLAVQKLHFIPVLLAAGWFRGRGVVATTALVSAVFVAHILLRWSGLEMLQADQYADAANLWLVAFVSWALVSRLRRSERATRTAHEETLTALASSLELRERYTAGHSRRVRDYALLLADRLGLPDQARASTARGALLHDIGKIGIEDAILLKEGALTGEERLAMQRHPAMGADLIGGIPSLQPERELVLAHHERFDGQGYPRGLAGDAIPLGARIFAVADALDAMTTDRPYHAAASFEEAREQIVSGRGKQFDPGVVDAFLEVRFEAWAETAARSGSRLRQR